MIATDPKRQEAHAALMASVLDLIADGNTVPCCSTESALWTSENHDDQTYAARACRDCPGLEACGAYITDHPEPAGVWAGRTEKGRHR